VLWASSRDVAFGVEPPVRRAFAIDRTPPALSCSADPAVLWPPNRKLVPVAVRVSIADAASGAAGFELSSVTGDGADGDGDGDVQGWSTGGADVAGLLRAERDGGRARRYVLRYRSADVAGNTADCAVTVTVPARHP
jgi:sialidase-1